MESVNEVVENIRAVQQVLSGKPAVYLAGGISDWREKIKARWRGFITPLDPFTDSKQLSLAQFTVDDLALIDRSVAVLAYHDYHVFDGLALEAGYAFAKDKLVVYVCTEPRLSSMICGVAKGVFTDLDAGVEFLERKIGVTVKPEEPGVIGSKAEERPVSTGETEGGRRRYTLPGSEGRRSMGLPIHGG